MSYFSDIIKSINKTKINLMEEENFKEVKKEYIPFVMNRIFSYFPDTILIVNEMNKRQGLSKELHYKFLLYAVSPNYRFKQMTKKEKNEDVERS